MRIVFALLFALALGCGKKEEESADSSGGAGTSSNDIPAPPTPGRIESSVWSPAELAAARAEARNDLRQLGIGLHAFEDINGYFPVGFLDSSGKKLGLSWRVQILPFIEEGELYKEFKLDEPWDSEHNKKLIRRMPKHFALKSMSDPRGYTHLRGFSGDGMLSFNPPNQPQPGLPARGTRFADAQDGTSNTILVAEVEEPTIWTKPDEIAFQYHGQQPTPRLGGVFEDGATILLADGSVMFLKNSIPDATIRALISRHDGMVISIP